MSKYSSKFTLMQKFTKFSTARATFENCISYEGSPAVSLSVESKLHC